MGQGKGHGEAGGQGRGHGSGSEGHGYIVGFCCIVIVAVILVLALFGLGIAKIVMGAVYIDDCPVQDLIPIYLIVSGCCPILMGGLTRFNQKKDEDVVEDVTLKNKCNIPTIIGSVWVFGNYSDVMDGCGVPDDCCDKKLMKFALAMVIIDWIFIGLIVLVICGLCGAICCGMFCMKKVDNV